MEDGWGNRYKIFLSKSQTCLIGGMIYWPIPLSPSKYSMSPTRFKIEEVRKYDGIKTIRKYVENFIGRYYFNGEEGNVLKHRGGRH